MKAFLLTSTATCLLLAAFAVVYLGVDLRRVPAVAADTLELIFENYTGGGREAPQAVVAPPTFPAEAAAPYPPSGNGALLLDVENLLQNPELPNGCEATSLAILLRHLGFYTDHVELAYNYIPNDPLYRVDGILYGPHPENAYAGDPADLHGGYYCLAPALVNGAEAYLAQQYADADIYNLTGISLDGLTGQLQGGNPVIVWCTMDYGPARFCQTGWQLAGGGTYLPYQNLHCMVLCGYDEEGFYLCDPLQPGTTWVDAASFEAGFEALGRQAVSVHLL